METLRVHRVSDLDGLPMTMKTAVNQRGMVDVRGIRHFLVAQLIVASIWTRRLCLSYKTDIDCYPSLMPSDRPSLPHSLHQISLTLVQKSTEGESLDQRQLLAVRPVVFSIPVDQLPAAEAAFSETVDVELPIVKIASQTHPNKAASTLMSFLCSTGGVQVFSTGSAANNQAMKAITVCRSYVRETDGYDVGFQCIHAPRDNRNGECQLVTWLRLMQDTSDQIGALDDDKIQFRIGNSNDAKLVGKSMASQIERNRRLDCMAVGTGAAGRSMVAVSHARIHLSQKQLDLVVLPNFDGAPSLWDLKEHARVPLKFDILSIKKKT